MTEDDRITCKVCKYYLSSGHCQAARQGLLPGTSRQYQPFPAIPRRCEAYLPNAQQDDQRNGAERWPNL